MAAATSQWLSLLTVLQAALAGLQLLQGMYLHVAAGRQAFTRFRCLWYAAVGMSVNAGGVRGSN